MASPSEASIQDQIGKVFKAFEEFRLFGHVNSPNLVQMEGDIIAALEGDYSAAAAGGFAGFRAALDSAIRQPAAATTPLLQTYAQFLDVPETDPNSIIDRIIDHFILNSLSVQTRSFSFGVPAAGGGNVGDGVLNRLTLDENTDDIEAQHADAKTLACLSDEHSGAFEHEEVFEMRGATALKDGIEVGGSGLVGSIKSLAVSDSRALVQNPSWDDREGTDATPTAIGGWTVGSSIGNFALDATNFYRGGLGITTPRALVIEDNDSLQQNLNVLRAQFDPSIPVYIQVAYNGSVGGATGKLTLTLGSQTVNVPDLTVVPAGWNILRLPLDQNLWFKNWNEEDPLVKVELTLRSSGTVLVDDLILSPMTQFDGAFYALVGGATPFLRDDSFSFLDTEVGAIIQHWFWRGYGRYLPHSGSPTWSEPTTIDPTPTPTPSDTPTPTGTTPTATPSPTPTPT